jgi:hypothetical protein
VIRRRWSWLVGLSAALAVTACSNTAPLRYTGTARIGEPTATISALQVDDHRGEPDPTWYGAIRGGYGNPLKTLHSDKPLNTTIRDAFVTALAARGIRLDPNAKGPSISVTVADFEADEVIRSEVKVRFEVAVYDATTGTQLYQREIFEDPVQGGSLVGVFADPRDLQSMAQATLTRAIDDALDGPGFLAVIRSHQSNGV